MSSYRSLVDKFERTKRELGEAESTIRRLTGRDPDDVTSVPGSRVYVRSVDVVGFTLQMTSADKVYRTSGMKGFKKNNELARVDEESGKRLSSSAAVPSRPSFSNRKKPSYTVRKRSRERESSYEESSSDGESPSKKPTIQSTVVAKRHQKRSRKATIEEQNANSKIRMRNRRMFGAIVATLKKFESEEVERQRQEQMRAEIESKVEAATEEERERIKQEKEDLFITRREKQTQLRCLEKKIERAESHEVFDANHHYLLNYIMTKSKPPIFFLPSSHTSETRKAHQESRSKIEEIIKKRKESFETDLAEIDEWYRKDSSMPGDKENKRPKEESESRDVPETESESLVVEQEDTGHDSNSNQISNSNSNLNSDSNDDDEDSSTAKNVGSLADQDFEPIYD